MHAATFLTRGALRIYLCMYQLRVTTGFLFGNEISLLLIKAKGLLYCILETYQAMLLLPFLLKAIFRQTAAANWWAFTQRYVQLHPYAISMKLSSKICHFENNVLLMQKH